MDSLRWGEFREKNEDLAAKGHALLYQYGIGLGFIATVRKDGGPRVHPCCPILIEDGLYVFVLGNSPKRYDLDRDGRYALHSNPPAENDDEFYIAGIVKNIDDLDLREKVSNIAQHDVQDTEVLYELTITRVLHTTWINPRQSDTQPVYSKFILDAYHGV